MPKMLVDFLASLSMSEAKRLWEWLDSESDAISEMIIAICGPRGLGVPEVSDEDLETL